MFLERELQRNPLNEIGTDGNFTLSEIRILDLFNPYPANVENRVSS
jgi:hypothetical protein